MENLKGLSLNSTRTDVGLGGAVAESHRLWLVPPKSLAGSTKEGVAEYPNLRPHSQNSFSTLASFQESWAVKSNTKGPMCLLTK